MPPRRSTASRTACARRAAVPRSFASASTETASLSRTATCRAVLGSGRRAPSTAGPQTLHTLNRPEKRNAISFRMQEEVHDALWDADRDTDVHAVRIAGAGMAFCAGYDLVGGGGGPPPGMREGATYRGGRTIDDDSWNLERA